MTGLERKAIGAVIRSFVAAGGIVLASAGWTAAQDDMTFKVTAYKQAVAELIGENDKVAAFYRGRDFQPIWTGDSDADKARRLALLEAFSWASDHGLPAARFDPAKLMAQMSGVQGDRARGTLEIALTQTYLEFAHALQSGLLEPGKVVSNIKRKPLRRDDGDLLARLVEDDPRAVMRSFIPSTAEYTRLMRAKLRLEHKIKHGGWGPVVAANKLSPGQNGNSVVALRNRLTAMGYMTPSLSPRYDDRLESAVRDFQEAHGLNPDGVAGSGTLREINTAPERRLASIMVAMERERWLNLPDGRGKRHVLVNLVDFHAQIIDDDKLTFRTRSVIGHQDFDRRTPEFSDVMEHMVINPSWYVPRSIIVNEYLPKLRANPGAVGHLQIIDSRGRVVNRGQGFAQYSARTFPFSMKQPPGPRNALGSVKFMFPNKYNIYLHDTPSQSLFKRDVRTFSHGCIRLDDPHDFAYALLAVQRADPVTYFKSVLRSGSETTVKLEKPVPVHLIYRTAYTQAKGPVNFRRDVYNRDEKIWRALQAQGVALRTGRS